MDEIDTVLRESMPRIADLLRPGLGSDAEDIMQEALLRAWTRLLAGDRIESLPAWVTTVARNIGTDMARRAQREQAAYARWASWTTPSVAHSDLDADLLDAVAKLPRHQRLALTIHYYADLPVKDVAQLLRKPEGSVKSDLRRGREALRRFLSKETAMKGWFLQGANPSMYTLAVDPDEQYEGKRIAVVRSTTATRDANCVMLQVFDPADYVGRRMRFSAAVRTHNLSGWAGLYMQFNDNRTGARLAFDNMIDRPIKGTTPWTRHAVILDCAPTADFAGFGLVFSGTGEAALSDVRFEEAPDDQPTALQRSINPRPINLDFSE